MSRLSHHFVVVMVLLTSCAPYHSDRGPILNPPQKLIRASSYTELYNTVLEPKCLGCHGPGARVSFADYVSTRRALAAIRREVIERRSMPEPPYAPLTDRELQTVVAWVLAQGPERPADGGVPPEIAPLLPTFASVQRKILIPKCIACHRSGGEAKRAPFETAQELMNSPLEFVIPGNPADSAIYIAVTAGAHKPMPPPRRGIAPLTASEIAAVHDWIASGAPLE